MDTEIQEKYDFRLHLLLSFVNSSTMLHLRTRYSTTLMQEEFLR